MLSPDFRFLEPGRGNIGTVITKRNVSVCLLINYCHWIQSGGGFDKVSLINVCDCWVEYFLSVTCVRRTRLQGLNMTLS